MWHSPRFFVKNGTRATSRIEFRFLMANILLTETCVRSCPYCFAKQYMANNINENDYISWDNLIYIADFLSASGENHVSLLGGEPLLHPQISSIIKYLNQRNLSVTIFTSGIMPIDRLQRFVVELNELQNLRVGFVCNVNEPRFSPKNELERVEQFLSLFANRTSLSFNIYRTDFEMTFLRDYIVRFGLDRHIRLGLAHPIPGKKNKYIPTNEFSIVKDKLIQFFVENQSLGIVPGFDCGFPMCMFSDEELGLMFKLSIGQLCFQCGPAIDIDAELNVWSCFPLSDFNKKSLFDFNTYGELAKFYLDKMEEVRSERRGIYPQCDDCSHNKHGLCSGGCLAHILNSFIEEGDFRKKEQ